MFTKRCSVGLTAIGWQKPETGSQRNAVVVRHVVGTSRSSAVRKPAQHPVACFHSISNTCACLYMHDPADGAKRSCFGIRLDGICSNLAQIHPLCCCGKLRGPCDRYCNANAGTVVKASVLKKDRKVGQNIRQLCAIIHKRRLRRDAICCLHSPKEGSQPKRRPLKITPFRFQPISGHEPGIHRALTS